MSYVFNRFSTTKQAQVEQLVAYAQLMGLSGKDLVAIGGKMHREQVKSEQQSRLDLAMSVPVFAPRRGRKASMTEFKVQSINGFYRIRYLGYGDYEIANSKGKRRKHYPDLYDNNLPRTRNTLVNSYRNILYDIATGKLVLDW